MTEPGAPPDPFGPMDADSIALLARFRSHRAAGGSLVESTCLLAAFFLAVYAANAQQQEGP